VSLSSEDIKLFGEPLIAHESAFGADYYLFGKELYVVSLPKYNVVNDEIVQFGYAFLRRYNISYHYSIFLLDTFTDVAKDVRDWAADPLKVRFSLADAIVLKDSGQKILSDFYIKQQHPSWPTQIFFDLQSAIDWIEERKKGS